MTSTPQPERREAEIAAFIREFRRLHGDDLSPEFEAQWLYARGLRLVGGEAPNVERLAALLEACANAGPIAPLDIARWLIERGVRVPRIISTSGQR